MEMFKRSSLLLGEDATQRLQNSRVAVFGIGGVGSFCLEALVRTGVGEIYIIDSDNVEESNLNRQIISTCETLGKAKVKVAKKRCEDINPQVKIVPCKMFYSAESEIDLTQFDYIIDAIDSVPSKTHLILKAKETGVPIISCMGTGNKLNPLSFEVADIYKTEGCPLAKAMRQRLKKAGVKALKVLYSKETPIKNGTSEIGSIVTVTGTAGLILANEAIKDLLDK